MKLSFRDDGTAVLTADGLSLFARTKSPSSGNFGFMPIASPRVGEPGSDTDPSASLPQNGDGGEQGVLSFGVPVSGLVDDGELKIELVGEVDRAVPVDGRYFRLEFLTEIRRRPRGITAIHDPRFFARSLVSAALFQPEFSPDGVEVIVTYYHPGSGESVSFSRAFDPATLAALLESLYCRAKPFISILARMHTDGRDGLRKMRFPYGTPRRGQREFIEECYRTAVKRGRLIVTAPTGIGKTVSVLYPALKAVADGYIDKIFYLTAKGVGANAAIAAAEDFSRAVPELRTVAVSSKERVCKNRDFLALGCGAYCNLVGEVDGESYVERRDRALDELFSGYSVVTSKEIAAASQKYSLCPYELSLDATEYATVVICDYNYIFDPSVRFKRYFGEDGRSPTGRFFFAIDEAHNLPDRIRAINTAVFDEAEFKRASNGAREAFEGDAELASALDGIGVMFTKLARDARSEGDGDRRDGCRASADVPPFLSPPIGELAAVTGARIRADREYAEGFLGELRSASRKFMRVLDGFSETSRYFGETDGENARASLICLDPSQKIDESLSLAAASVMFSATMSPLDYYRELFGSPNAAMLDLPSPYAPENLRVTVVDSLSTRLADRRRTAFETAEMIAAMTAAKLGNYLCYFPSYEYMKDVARHYRHIDPDSRLVLQSSGMSLAARRKFLAAFQGDGEPTVGFSVLGGVFSEGVDLPGDRLIGCAIVGIGLGALTSRDNLLASYYEEKRGSGNEFAYIYPGMNRVLQAAGRVIRGEDDRGVVLLIDDRYANPGITRLFPDHWHSVKLAADPVTLEEMLREFWEE